jgi:hypothetical protein
MNRNIWLDGAEGERQAIRVDSRTTGGAYAIVESVAAPGCAVPTHLHRNEDEHCLIIFRKRHAGCAIPELAAQFGCLILGPPVA